MRKVVVVGLVCCLAEMIAVPWARAQDGAVIATGELFVRRTIFCLDGGELDPENPSACDDQETTVFTNFVEIEFPADGSGVVTGAWELVAERAYTGSDSFCRHESGGTLTGTYDPSTRMITGDQLEPGSLRAFGYENGECTRPIEQPPLGAWEAEFDGNAVFGRIEVDDGAGRPTVGGLGFYAPATGATDVGTIPDGDAGPGLDDEDEAGADEDDAVYDPSTFDSIVESMEEDDEGGVPVAAVAGGAVVLGGGVVAASRMRRARNRRTPTRELTEDDRAPDDPCSEQRARVAETRARAMGMQRGLETLRALDRQLEDAWNNGREAGYWSASVDIASFASGGVPDAVLTTVGKGVVTAAVKTLGESAAKDFLGWAATDMSANPSAWPSGVPEDVGKTLAMNRLRQYASGHMIDRIVDHELTRGALDPDLLRRVSVAQGAFRAAVMQPIEMAVESAGLLMKVFGGTLDSVDSLEEIRGQQQRVTSHINNLENQLSDTLNEQDLAQHALALCEKPAGAAMP